MTELSCQAARIHIDGLIDGELTAAEAERLQRHLAGCADCRARLDAKRQLVAMLSSSLERPRLDPLMRKRLLKRRSVTVWWPALPTAALAASLALFFMSPSAGDAVLDAHLRSLTPGHLTDIDSSDRHSVKPWFNGKLAISPPVPDLADQEFPLVGGRLDSIGGQSAACLVYRRQQHIINLCLWPGGPRLSANSERRGFNLLSWQQDGQQIAVISDLNFSELEQFKALWIERSHDASNSH